MLAILLLIRRIVLLLMTGWRLATKGRGITQRQQSPLHDVNARQGPTGAITPTIELPITPAISAGVAAQIARGRRTIKIVIFSGMAFFLLLGGGVDLAVPSPSGVKVFPYLAAVSLGYGLFIGGVWLIASRLLRRDLVAFTYFRTVGPVELVRLHGGYLLRLADRAFTLNAQAPVAALRNLTWATVDHSLHAHVIFEVRDRSGRTVYCLEPAKV